MNKITFNRQLDSLQMCSYLYNRKEYSMTMIDDDFSIYDGDDTVCDDDRDGLTSEEVVTYERECEILQRFSDLLSEKLGYYGRQDYAHSRI